jgi:hypothetical protein
VPLEVHGGQYGHGATRWMSSHVKVTFS